MKQKKLFENNITISELIPCVICYVPGSGVNKLKQVLFGNFNLTPVAHSHQVPVNYKKSQNESSDLKIINSPSRLWKDQSSSNRDTVSTQSVLNLPIAEPQRAFKPDYNLFPTMDEIDLLPIYNSNSPIIATHCMSSLIVKQQFPNRKIVKIVGDVISSLRRWYVVYEKQQNYPDPPVSSKWNFWLNQLQHDPIKLHIAHQILAHLEYYQQHWDRGCDFLVDIAEDDCYFSKFMSNDFKLCQSSEFDQVLDVLKQSEEFQEILSQIS
jgi:hypothetical protein